MGLRPDASARRVDADDDVGQCSHSTDCAAWAMFTGQTEGTSICLTQPGPVFR